jgi:hypothetical protein
MMILQLAQESPEGDHSMKKLMTLMLGLAIVLGSTAVFADDAPTKTKKTKATKVPKTKKTKEKKTT